MTEADAAIHACMSSYTRGVDRLDGELIAAAFHPGAVLEAYGPEPTTIEAFVERVIPSLRDRFDATQHRVSNMTINHRTDHALVETYVLAFHATETRLYTFNGRYIDRFEERSGEWRIAHRRLRVDWSKVEDIDEPMSGKWVQSARDRTDPVYD